MKATKFIIVSFVLAFIELSSVSSVSGFSLTRPFSTSPWAKFLSLAGCHLGDVNPAVHELKDYLYRFGYFDTENFSDTFDTALESALKTYQQNFNLNVTGLLDLSTVKQIVSPRCGVADFVNGTSYMSSGKASGRHLFEFFPGNPTWPSSKKQLTYAITSTSEVDIDPSVIRAVFTRAFSRWSAVMTLNFTEVTSESDADIMIGFYGGDHGDGVPFDGPLQTLAHAFAPRDGRFHLDAAEDWVAEGDVTMATSGDAVDLESVAVHEIGHLLGLGHSSVVEAIMYPTITTRTRKVELARDDVEGVQMLYGSNPNYPGCGISPVASTGKPEMEASDGGVRLRGLGWKGVFEWVLAGYTMLLLL